MKPFLLLLALLTQLTLAGPCAAQVTLLPPEQIDALRQRAEAGDALARREFGLALLHNGDPDEGLDWLRRAARDRDWFSANFLAGAYLYGGYSLSDDGSGEGIAWLRLAGQNVPPDLPAADEIYRLLGRLYSGVELEGVRGYPPVDEPEAIRWYRLCAVGDDSYCQRELADILIKSPATATEGYRWLRHAADRANPWAMVDLGELYAAGTIVPQDNVQSLAWFERAQTWNPGTGLYGQYLVAEIESKIADISALLSPAEQAKAREIADNFHPATPD
jgi:TPR repeat protein